MLRHARTEYWSKRQRLLKTSEIAPEVSARIASGDLSFSFGRKGNGRRNSADRRQVRERTAYCRTMCRIACSESSCHPLPKENFMNDTKRTAVFFLAGLGI